MSIIKEILPRIYSWSEFNEERQLNFNGYFVIHKDASVIIDPPKLSDRGLRELKDLVALNISTPVKAILLTNVHHDRSCQELKKIFPIPIYINEKDRDLLDIKSDKTCKDGDRLFCGIRVVHISDQKSPGESAFYIEDRKVLIVGDALIGKVQGEVNMLPPEKFEDADKAKAGLHVLRELDFESLLVGDGHSILEDAKAKVEKFLDA